MFSVLMRAFSFTLIIIIGIVMKSTGFVPKDAGASVKKFLIYVTLPASIITNFSAIEDMGFNMLIIAALGILLNVIMIAVCAVIFYFVLPFDLVIRQTLVLLCFAPMSAVAPAYTGMCGGDEGMASCANSVSILCSLVVITALLAIMGLY